MWRGYHHMNGGGEGSPPHTHTCAGHGERGYPPPPIKGHPLPPSSSHLLMKDLSLPLALFPHGLGLARYMFPVALSGKELLLLLLCWSEGRRLSGYRTCVRSRMHRFFAVLDLVVLELDLMDVLEPDLLDFITILRSASVRLHQPRVPTR